MLSEIPRRYMVNTAELRQIFPLRENTLRHVVEGDGRYPRAMTPSDIGINIGDSLITTSSESPSNLGVLFDSTCSLNDDVSKICKSINYNLYSIGKIRKYLDTPTAEKIINCSITSRLDYWNSLPYGAKGYSISQLQLCQNNATRVLSLRRKFDHITPILKDLHWLPVEQRI